MVFLGSPKMFSFKCIKSSVISLLEMHLPKLKGLFHGVSMGSRAPVTMKKNGKIIQDTSAKSC